MRVIGIEVAKATIVVCSLETLPEKPARFAKTYRPVTYSVNRDDLDKLASSGDVFILEPTGVYSRIWFDYLLSAGKDVRKANPKRVANLRRYHGIESKSDRYDAFFLALYGLLNHADPEAFLELNIEVLRDLVLEHRSLSKHITQSVNHLWRSLAYEWPEACQGVKGKKPKQNRDFLDKNPGGLWRFLAGEKIRGSASRQASLDGTVGRGLSDLTRLMAAHVCQLERHQFQLEGQLLMLQQCSEFEDYSRVFDSFEFGPMTRAIVLAHVYPFHRFLESGRPRVEYVINDKGKRSKRNRSLSGFRLSLGMGTVLYQSGQVQKEVPGGPGACRAALFCHVKTKLVMHTPAAGAGQRRRQHYEYYQAIPSDVPHFRAVMKVAAKIVTDLYRDLLVSTAR